MSVGKTIGSPLSSFYQYKKCITLAIIHEKQWAMLKKNTGTRTKVVHLARYTPNNSDNSLYTGGYYVGYRATSVSAIHAVFAF